MPGRRRTRERVEERRRVVLPQARAVSRRIVAILLICASLGAGGEALALQQAPIGSDVSQQPAPPQSRPPTPGPGEALESPVAGEDYILGPGDRLTISIWRPQPVTYELTISLEGGVLLPSVGDVRVSGLTLNDARELIADELRSQYRDARITITLTRLRRFQVHVLGQVESPGTYLASAVDRISAAVAWAGGLTEDASQRRILVFNGDVHRASGDLFLFLKRGVPNYNPLLRDGDIVYVPFAGETFSVKGAVHEPGEYEYLPGDMLSDALFFAGGMTPEAFRDSIEIARHRSTRGDPLRFFATSSGAIVPAEPGDEADVPAPASFFTSTDTLLSAPHEPVYPNCLIFPDDIVFVRYVPEDRIKDIVEIQGEVVHPGEYSIEEDRVRVSDVIQRAGGFTPDAFLEEASLVRREPVGQQDREFERLKDL
ncbi:MAG: hypothetical protein GF355_03150, partial [Candidatus Eisenbacteria bacterium]|nr:hypothetical protein [Candidatus Eisenbacteria bacterium]